MRRRIFRRALNIDVGSFGAAGAQPTAEVDLFAWRAALVEEVVLAWSEPIPVTPEALETLSTEVQDWIAAEFDKLAGGRSEQEKKDLSASSSSGSRRRPAAASRRS
jgi:hypothetical protein